MGLIQMTEKSKGLCIGRYVVIIIILIIWGMNVYEWSQLNMTLL